MGIATQDRELGAPKIAVAERKLLLAELRGQRPARPPIWLMRQAGRYLPEYQQLREREPDFIKFCYTPDLTLEAALQPLRRYPLDAAIVFSDILVVPDALGQKVRFVEGTGPVLDPLGSSAEVEQLSLERLAQHLAPVYESCRQLAAALAEDVALIGFAGSPWTVAVYMVEGRGGSGCERTRVLAYREESLFGRLIDILIEATIAHLKRQIEAGAEVVQVFDTWAGGLPPDQFKCWVIEPTRRIVDEIRGTFPQVPVIGFARGAGVGYRDYVMETGVTAVGIDTAVPLGWAAEALQDICVVQGNLDNVLLLSGGRKLGESTGRILETLASRGFIFNLGHGVLPGTPLEHVAELVAHVHQWRRT